MKRLIFCMILSLGPALVHGQAQKTNSLIDSLKKQHKTYDNNSVKHSNKARHQTKKHKGFKASSMMDTLGNKPNTNEPDK